MHPSGGFQPWVRVPNGTWRTADGTEVRKLERVRAFGDCAGTRLRIPLRRGKEGTGERPALTAQRTVPTRSTRRSRRYFFLGFGL
jgi:hypothetical protein